MPDTGVAQAAAHHYIGFQSNLNPNKETGEGYSVFGLLPILFEKAQPGDHVYSEMSGFGDHAYSKTK